MSTEISYNLSLIRKIIEGLGYELIPDSVIMDFGCGSGKTVQALRKLGYQAFGSDIQFKNNEDTDTESMKDKGIIRLIDAKHYVLPFDDNTFDFILNDQVFEHVKNYDE